MWFLWGLITFLVCTFSTSQILAYIVCFIRYPQMLEDMPSINKMKVFCGCLLHSSISILFIILVCAIPSIGKYWIVCLITAIISFSFAIYGITHDPDLKKNFASLTGYDRKVAEKIIKKLRSNNNNSLQNNNISDFNENDDI